METADTRIFTAWNGCRRILVFSLFAWVQDSMRSVLHAAPKPAPPTPRLLVLKVFPRRELCQGTLQLAEAQPGLLAQRSFSGPCEAVARNVAGEHDADPAGFFAEGFVADEAPFDHDEVWRI
jgi:hypothetical protein